MLKKYLIVGCIILLGCAQMAHKSQLQKYTKSGQFFGSVVNFDVCYQPNQKEALPQAMDAIWQRFADIHGRLSVYDPDSDMSRINHAYPDAVTVGPDTYGIIKDSIYYNKFSDGTFDITIYPLIRAWKAAEKNGVLPSLQDIQTVQLDMGPDKIELLGHNRLRLLRPGTTLTIDSIADGYAADEAARILRAYGFNNFMADVTGEVYVSGNNCKGQPWRIGVQDPNDPSKITDVLLLKDAAVSTSGNYERFYTVGKKHFSHIINPKTGYPRDDIKSATVIAPNAQFSDFWSTALCLLDPKRGIDLIDALGEGYASMVMVDEGGGKSVKKASRNYAAYLAR